MSRELLQPDAHGLITRSGAAEAGVTDRALRDLVRGGELTRLRRGVYVFTERWASLDDHRAKPLLRVRAAQSVLRCQDAVLSHDSASLVHGLGVPDPVHCQVHVTRRKVHGDADRAGVKHHRAPYRDEEVVVVDGLRVLDRARTALDMAREHGLRAGVACCDAALRSGVSARGLEDARRHMWCWPGSTVMDACLALADAGAESWLESDGRVLVHSLGIGPIETQFGLTDGRRRVWCDLRVGRHIFEVDGRGKYGDQAEVWAEKKRQDFVSGFKLGVSRITAHDCGAGRKAAQARLRREYDDTCRRFGTDISDLMPFVIRGRRVA